MAKEESFFVGIDGALRIEDLLKRQIEEPTAIKCDFGWSRTLGRERSLRKRESDFDGDKDDADAAEFENVPKKKARNR